MAAAAALREEEVEEESVEDAARNTFMAVSRVGLVPTNRLMRRGAFGLGLDLTLECRGGRRHRKLHKSTHKRSSQI